MVIRVSSMKYKIELIVEKAIEKQLYKGFGGEHAIVGGYKAKI